MTHSKRWALVGLAVSLFAVATMTEAIAGEPVTVGDFVQGLARARSLAAIDATTATASLAAAGVRLPADLDFAETLTESDVARLSRLLGLRVSTTRPDRPFDAAQVEQFFLVFADELGGGAGDDNRTRNGETPDGESGDAPGDGPPFNPYTKGKGQGGAKGKKKGHGGPVSPTEPDA